MVKLKALIRAWASCMVLVVAAMPPILAGTSDISTCSYTVCPCCPLWMGDLTLLDLSWWIIVPPAQVAYQLSARLQARTG